MLKLNETLIKVIKDNKLNDDLFEGQFGLEKENVRVAKDGKLALTPHPKTFGDKIKNPYITTDFSESQVEVITPPMDSIEETYNMLETLHNIVSLHLDKELLWPQSTPPILPDEASIPLAQFGDSEGSMEKNKYREELAKKYGKRKQLISGIHYNFSFNDDFLKNVHEAQGKKETFEEFKNQWYLKIMRHTIKYSWLLIKLLGSSPSVDDSYSQYCKDSGLSTSIRNGRCGYMNLSDFYVPLDNLKAYVTGVNQLVVSGVLSSPREYYSYIRPKNKGGEHNQLLNTGIEYIELRLIDINPLYKVGISLNDLYLVHSFLILMALLEDEPMNENIFTESMKNNRKVADHGRNEDTCLFVDGLCREEGDLALDIVKSTTEIINLKTKDKNKYLDMASDFEERLLNPNKLYSEIIYKQLTDEGFIEYHLKKANLYLKESRAQEFNFIGYEDMELSTQILILDAMRRGIRVDMLDRHENFIKLTQDDNTEIVKQATKTSKDNYSTVLVMENKAVTKKVLTAAGIKTPDGGIYESYEKALLDFSKFEKKSIVVKPNSTNFGIGITIFTTGFSYDVYKKALELAFGHDTTILIETFMVGKEYRVFVIGEEVVAAMHRVPANVMGDGVSNITKLVKEKNQSPLRGTGYRKPLQKINLGQEENMFLSQSHRDFETVPKLNEVVYLRENSNISTGGDSLDMTDEISEAYKKIALESAKAVNATITGVDIITPDITAEKNLEYAVIELNFNPAIHIHCYPFKGKNRHLGDKILDHLNFN